eukprot:c12771_g1_i1 orf=597-1862(+)
MAIRFRQKTESWVLCTLFLIVLGLTTSALCVSSQDFLPNRRQFRIQRQLKKMNKPAVRSIQSPDGDIIDCVLLSQQPAFDHPKLRNHKIQVQPTFPEGMERPMESGENSEQKGKPQLWHSAGKCPKGTIPIRRTTEEDILRAKVAKNYGRKFHLPVNIRPPAAHDIRLNENGHQHAIAYVEGDNYFGAKAVINVWDPSIEVANEFSLSQMWILAGSFNGDLNSIEAGWQVSPDLYGDNNTRLFTYWTNDAYQGTGCYNLLCSGFVQISYEIAIGATISPVSYYNDKQYDISILIWKDPKLGNWWMQFGDRYILGYWPASLFSYLAESASMVEWGGEVVNSEPNGQHTATQMGSGHFPVEGFGRASYFSKLQIVDSTNNLRPPSDLNTFAENPNCYDVQTGFNSDWANFFYYGGPGLSGDCP